MTESEKQRAIAWCEERAWIAEKQHLDHTAKSWRDYAYRLSLQPAEEIVLGNKELGLQDGANG